MIIMRKKFRLCLHPHPQQQQHHQHNNICRNNTLVQSLASFLKKKSSEIIKRYFLCSNLYLQRKLNKLISRICNNMKYDVICEWEKI